MAAVSVDGKWGYIDPLGQFVIPPQFDWAQPFSESLAGVKVDDKWGFIDMTGQFVIKPQLHGARPFQGGLGLIRNAEHRLGLVDRTGKVVASFLFVDGGISSFSGDLAIIKGTEN